MSSKHVTKTVYTLHKRDTTSTALLYAKMNQASRHDILQDDLNIDSKMISKMTCKIDGNKNSSTA